MLETSDFSENQDPHHLSDISNSSNKGKKNTDKRNNHRLTASPSQLAELAALLDSSNDTKGETSDHNISTMSESMDTAVPTTSAIVEEEEQQVVHITPYAPDSEEKNTFNISNSDNTQELMRFFIFW